MSFNPSAKDDKTVKYELTPVGPTVARCVRVIEIGKQDSKYGVQERCVINFSLPFHFIKLGEEEKQKFISQPFGINMSNNEGSTMAEYVKALNPEAEDLGGFLDRTCQLNIVHYERRDGKGRGERIDSVTRLLPGIEVPELDTEPFWFSWKDPDPQVWGKIPPFTKSLIQEAVNYPDSKVEAMVKQLEGGDIKGKETPALDNSDSLPF